MNKLAFAHTDLPIVRMLVDEADAIADGLLQVQQHSLLPQCAPSERLRDLMPHSSLSSWIVSSFEQCQQQRQW